MDPYLHILSTWDKLAKTYEEKFMKLQDYNASYDLFLASLKTSNSEILEIACGPGMITKYLLEKNSLLKITATDASPSMLELAKQNCPGADTLLMDCRNLHELQKNFDGIVCGFVLPYLTIQDTGKLIKEIALHLNPNGVLYLSAIEGNYVQSHSVKSSDGLHEMMNYYYSENDLTKILIENKLQVLHCIRLFQNKKENNNAQIILIARK